MQTVFSGVTSESPSLPLVGMWRAAESRRIPSGHVCWRGCAVQVRACFPTTDEQRERSRHARLSSQQIPKGWEPVGDPRETYVDRQSKCASLSTELSQSEQPSASRSLGGPDGPSPRSASVRLAMDEDTAALTPRRLPNSEIAHRLGPVLPGPSKPGDLRISFGHRPTPVAPQRPRQVDEWRRAAPAGALGGGPR